MTEEERGLKWSGNWRDDWKEIAEEIKNALWKPAKSWTVGWLKPSQVPDNFEGREIKRGKDYIVIRLKSMRIPYETIGWKKFYGAVHSFIGLDTFTAGNVVFNVVTTPTQLQNIDRSGLMNVINLDIVLLGPVPYQGGDINLEAGVFSVLADNLIAPFLKVIEDVSKTAGISVINQAIPFVQPIENAIYHLIGYNKENKLEIGIKMPLIQDSLKEGYLVVVGTPPDGNFISTLRLKKDGRLFKGEKEIEEIPYMVLTVKAKKRRGSYNIPDVQKALEDLLTALQKRDKEIILKYYGDFKAVVLRSANDLLPKDAHEYIEEIYQERVKPVLDSLERNQDKP